MNTLHPILEAFWKTLREYHDLVRFNLEDLPLPALDWTTEHSKNSIAVLVVHMMAAEGYWVGEVLGGMPQVRSRKAEFATRGLHADELRACINEREAETRTVLEGIDPGHLSELRSLRGKTVTEVTGHWALQHVLTHTAYHTGQMNLIRKSWLDRASM